MIAFLILFIFIIGVITVYRFISSLSAVMTEKVLKWINKHQSTAWRFVRIVVVNLHI